MNPHSSKGPIKNHKISQADIKNLLGIENVDHLPTSLTHDPRIYSKLLTEEDLVKEREHKERVNKDKEREDKYEKKRDNNQHKNGKLEALTPRDVKILVRAEEELSHAKVRKSFLTRQHF